MMNRRATLEAAERKAARKRREEAAGRLVDAFPALRSLRLAVQEYRTGAPNAECEHVRRVVIEHAPALFELPCTDAHCQDGGYDVTHEIVRALRAGQSSFEGRQACQGRRGTGECNRFLRYVADASYGSAL